jgi:hypothetical protein
MTVLEGVSGDSKKVVEWQRSFGKPRRGCSWPDEDERHWQMHVLVCWMCSVGVRLV